MEFARTKIEKYIRQYEQGADGQPALNDRI